MGGRRNLIPAGLLAAAAFLLLMRPLGCRAPPPLVFEPDSGMPFEDAGPDAGPDAGDGGYHGDGGCEIGRTLVPRGSWLNVELGSCTYCDPDLNPNGYTVLDAGQPCRGFTSPTYYGGELTVPFEGVCGYEQPFGACGGALAGSSCNLSKGLGCKGGVCGANGWCEVTQNLGWFTACASWTAVTDNACASGPCCSDGGYAAVIPDGGGWCCGLGDAGTSTCFPAGTPCIDSSNCCPPLSCSGSDGTLPGDAGGSAGICQ